MRLGAGQRPAPDLSILRPSPLWVSAGLLPLRTGGNYGNYGTPFHIMRHLTTALEIRLRPIIINILQRSYDLRIYS